MKTNKLKTIEEIARQLRPDKEFEKSLRLIDRVKVDAEPTLVEDMDEQIRKSLGVPKVYEKMIRKGKGQ